VENQRRITGGHLFKNIRDAAFSGGAGALVGVGVVEVFQQISGSNVRPELFAAAGIGGILYGLVFWAETGIWRQVVYIKNNGVQSPRL